MELSTCVTTELTTSIKPKDEILLLEDRSAEPCGQQMPGSGMAMDDNHKLSSACLTDVGMVEQAAGWVSLFVAKTFLPASIPGYFLPGFLYSLFLFTPCSSLCLSIFQAHKSCCFLNVFIVSLNLSASCVLYENDFFIAVFSLYCVVNCYDCESALYLCL